jgi:3-deoxy-D-manno-octulosonic-acid transferase
MEWTEGSVIEFTERYKRKEIIWDPKHPKHFNKIRKQDAWEELGKEIKRPVDECKKENGELTVISLMGEMKMRKNSGTGKDEYF